MKIKLLTGLLALSSVTLVGCGSLNAQLADRRESVEMYHIFDIKTNAAPDVLIKATADGLARNTKSVSQNRPLVMGNQIPATPGRFQIVDASAALKGTGLGSMLAASQAPGALGLKSASCEGAVWTAKAIRDVPGSDRLDLYSCLYRYKDGYQLNVYAVFQKTSGGVLELSRQAAQALVGTPEQWVTKTIVDTVRSIQDAVKTEVVRIEGQPELGELPKVDRLAGTR